MVAAQVPTPSPISILGKLLVIILLFLAWLVATLFGFDTTTIVDAIKAILTDP